MSGLFVIHVSDTHYATDKDAFDHRLPNVAGLHNWPLGGVRKTLVQHGGARAANPRLWREFLHALQTTSDILEADGETVAVIHTGDISQGGQVGSLLEALKEIQMHVHDRQVHAVPGDHDLWPRNFPPFAASETGLQYFQIRNTRPLPSAYPHGPIRLAQELELLLFNSSVADSLLNSFALGKVEMDPTRVGSLPPQLTTPPQARMRAVALHHPVLDFSNGSWQMLQRAAGWNVGSALLDAPSEQARLASAGVSLVFCGHEHSLPNHSSRLFFDDRLLQLSAGCPTLWQGSGNRDNPQFSLYGLELEGSELVLNWYVCRLSPTRWKAEGRYRHDAVKWRADGTPRLPSWLATLPAPPFP